MRRVLMIKGCIALDSHIPYRLKTVSGTYNSFSFISLPILILTFPGPQTNQQSTSLDSGDTIYELLHRLPAESAPAVMTSPCYLT